jgi:hypothetical protein
MLGLLLRASKLSAIAVCNLSLINLNLPVDVTSSRLEIKKES